MERKTFNLPNGTCRYIGKRSPTHTNSTTLESIGRSPSGILLPLQRFLNLSPLMLPFGQTRLGRLRRISHFCIIIGKILPKMIYIYSLRLAYCNGISGSLTLRAAKSIGHFCPIHAVRGSWSLKTIVFSQLSEAKKGEAYSV